MFLQSRFHSLVPWDEGACRTKGVCPRQRWLLLPSLRQHVVQIRVVWCFEMCFWSFWLDIPSKDVLVGTAPLDCVEIPCVEGKSRWVPMLFLTALSPVLCSGRQLSLPLLPSPSRRGFPVWKACVRSQRLTHALGMLMSLLS